MAYKKFNSANNAFATLAFPIADTDTTMVLTGKYNRLPTTNFIVKITKTESWVVTARENVYVTSRSWATCTWLVRAYEPVPTNDDATTNIQQALPFAAWDLVEVVISSKFIQDIQEWFTEIPDMRDVAIGTPLSYANQKYVTYEFRPATWANAWALWITTSTSAWFALETINACNSVEWQYITQLAWSVHSSTFELFVRKATSTTAWWPWNKLLPLDAASLSVASVTELSAFTNIYDYIPFQRFWNTNLDRKVTVETLLKEIARLYCSWSSYSVAWGWYGWTSPAIAIPRGWLATGIIYGIYNSWGVHPNPQMQWSADGSTWWTTMMELVPWGTWTITWTCFMKPWYTRYSVWHNGYTSWSSFTVQIF